MDQQQHSSNKKDINTQTASSLNCLIVLEAGKHICVGYCTEEVTFWVFIKLFFLDIYKAWLQKTARCKG